MNSRAGQVRLLPWTGSRGQPCLLLTDDAGGFASRLADRIEDTQLGLAGRLLGRARDILARGGAQGGELGLLAEQLTDALADALLIARSRGARLMEQRPTFPGTGPSPTEVSRNRAGPQTHAMLALPGHDLASAHLARRHVRDIARSWNLPSGTVDDLETITAELVANTLEHSDSHTVTITCTLNDGTIAIGVTDQGNGRTPTAPTSIRPPGPEEEHGRGLLITAALAERWGTSRNGDGLTVWAEIAVGVVGATD